MKTKISIADSMNEETEKNLSVKEVIFSEAISVPISKSLDLNL